VGKKLRTLKKYLKKEKLMSVSNMLVMVITFLFLGIFIYVIVFSQTALRYLENEAQVTVFFKDEFKEESILSFKQEIDQDDRISDAEYVSKEDALRIFKEINQDEPILLESISASILPASLEIKTKNLSDLNTVATELSGREGVEEIRYFEDVIAEFRFWSRITYAVGFLLVVIFMIISYSVIVAMLRTTINSRGIEFEITKLVGASDNYVKKPLTYQGVFFGVITSGIASVFMLIIGIIIQVSDGLFSKGLAFGFIPGLFINPLLFSGILIVVLITSGGLLGYFGSNSTIKKYLNY